MKSVSTGNVSSLPRRTVLEVLAGGVAVACPICVAIASENKPHGPQTAATPVPAHKPHWSYEGEGAPEK